MQKLCCLCSLEFPSKSHCETQERIHLPWFLGQFICTICKEQFSSRKRLQTHLETSRHQKKLPGTARVDIGQLRSSIATLFQGKPAYPEVASLASQTVLTEWDLQSHTLESASHQPVTPQTAPLPSPGISSDTTLEEFLQGLDSLDLPTPNMKSIQQRDPGTPTIDELPAAETTVYSPYQHHGW